MCLPPWSPGPVGTPHHIHQHTHHTAITFIHPGWTMQPTDNLSKLKVIVVPICLDIPQNTAWGSTEIIYFPLFAIWSVGQPNQTKPVHTKPNQTDSNQFKLIKQKSN